MKTPTPVSLQSISTVSFGVVPQENLSNHRRKDFHILNLLTPIILLYLHSFFLSLPRSLPPFPRFPCLTASFVTASASTSTGVPADVLPRETLQ